MFATSLDADTRRVLALVEHAGNPPYHEMTAQAARAAHDKHAPVLDLPAQELALVEDITIPCADRLLPARRYARVAEPHNLPIVMWLHGGGHTVGSIQCYDNICRRLCHVSDTLVVAIGYRLAPEHRFPAAVDDTFEALQWLTHHGSQLGGDITRVAVAGDSAGGNLAAAAALNARDCGNARLRHQLLVYPALAGDAQFASRTQFATGYLLTQASIEWFQAHYLGERNAREDWRFAPLAAHDHSGVAPATVIVASHDPLRDEGVAYVDALTRAGTLAELIVAQGTVHAFWSMGGVIRAAQRSIDQAANILAKALHNAP